MSSCCSPAAKLGVTLACQNWRQADAELQHCIRLVEPALLVVSERARRRRSTALDHGAPRVLELGRRIRAALATRGTDESPDVAEPEDGLRHPLHQRHDGHAERRADQPAREIARACIASRTDFGVAPDDGFVAWSPLFHMGATDYSLGDADARRQGLRHRRLRSATGSSTIVAREPIGWLC